MPIWHITMPTNVIVVARFHSSCSGVPAPVGSPGCHPPCHSTNRKPVMTSRAEVRPRNKPCSGEQAALNDSLAGRPRRLLHDPGLGGLPAQRQGRQRLRPQVDGQDLKHRQRERDRAAGQCKAQEWNDFRGRMRKDVEDELADVVVDAPPLPDRPDDVREVVVGKHHRRRLACHLGARRPHRDADVGSAQRGGIVRRRHRSSQPHGPVAAEPHRSAASRRESCARRPGHRIPAGRLRAGRRASSPAPPR